MISWSVMSHTSSSDNFLILSTALFCRALIGDTRTGTRGRLAAGVGVVGWSSESESLPDGTSSKTSPGDWDRDFCDACSCFFVQNIRGAGAGARAGCTAWALAAVDLEAQVGATGSGFVASDCFCGCSEPPFSSGAQGMLCTDGGGKKDSAEIAR